MIFTEGYWQQLPTLPNIRWTETETKSVQGSSYSNRITARTRQLSAGASQVFDTLSRLPLILRLYDAQGNIFILGNHQEGFDLTFSRNQGSGGQFSGYQVNLSGQSRHSVQSYKPTLP